MPKDAKGKMRLDNNCSTITLSSEKEQLLARLLRLLKQQQGEHSMSDLQQALCEVGLQETVNRNERKEVDSDSADESEGGVVIGERERDQTTDFPQKILSNIASNSDLHILYQLCQLFVWLRPWTPRLLVGWISLRWDRIEFP